MNQTGGQGTMKVVYTLPVRPEVEVPVPSATPALTLGNTSIEWKCNSNQHLEAVVLEFSGIDINYTPEGSIDPAPPQVQEDAYRVASYIANRIYAQTSFEVIAPESVLMEAPRVLPETSAEEAKFKKTPRRMWTSINLGSSIRGTFDPVRYITDFDHSAAHGYYADALRAATLFQKYELLYKVVEYFFAEEGPALDKAVSIYVSTYDPTFTPYMMENLRLLRNRSVHPRARKGHISSESIASVREIRAGLPTLGRLVGLLLEHPTF
jgi:hypothetical protein